ncbi:MAG: acetyltransferase [Bacteroidota bacterium]
MDSNLTSMYLKLGSTLEETYPHRSFKNHCYWRIAMDNVLSDRWDKHVQRPAYRNLSEEQLKEVVNLLEQYQTDELLLMTHNKQSLQYRT